MITITKNHKDTNWVSGTMNDTFKFQALVFDEPSDFGIPTPNYENGNNISILLVEDAATGDEVYCFDRGEVDGNADLFCAEDFAELVMYLENAFIK